MTSPRFAALVLALLTAAVSQAAGDWAARTRAGEYAFAYGQLERAEREFQAALEIAQGFPPGDRRLEASLENLARLYEHRSDVDRAQPLYQLLLAAQEHRLGADDPGLLDTLYAIARVSQPTGDLPTAESSLRRYDAIATASGAADPRKWWQALALLARLAVIGDDPAQALAWQRRAVEVLDSDPAAGDDERAVQLESLARMELADGDGERGEALFFQVAALHEAAGDRVASARTAADGAAAAFAGGELAAAERLATLALGATPDPEAERGAREVLAEVSWMRVNRGSDDITQLLAAAAPDAELLLARERLAALVPAGGEPDDETLGRLVAVETLGGRATEAARWQRLVVARAPSAAAALAARRDLAALLAAAGENREALAENAAVLAAAEAELGPDHPRLLPLLEQRRDLLLRVGDKKAAKQVEKRIKKISR